MIVLACKKRGEIFAAPEPSVTPCTHLCGGVCTVGACRPYELAHLAGKPRAIAVNATKAIVATDAGLDVIDKKARTVRRLHPSCVGDAGLAANETEVFWVHCGAEVIGVDLGSGSSRTVSVLKTAVLPHRVVASAQRIGWLGGGRLEVVTTALEPVRTIPRDVAEVQLVGDRVYWSREDESIWSAREGEAPERLVQGYDARGPFAANPRGVFWANRHDRTLVRFVTGDPWPQWLGYDPLAGRVTQAIVDDEWLYYRHPEGLTKIGYAHWSEPTRIADDARDMASDGRSLFFVAERDGTSLMVLEP